MTKPLMILRDYLLMPIIATEERVDEIKSELEANNSKVNLNGLFLLLVSYIESMQKEVVKYYLKYNPQKINGDTITIDKAVLANDEDFYLLETILEDHIDKMPYWKLANLFYELLQIKKPATEIEIDSIKKRRNELIHKNLGVNFKRSEVNQDHVAAEYLENCIISYKSYLTDLRLSVLERYQKFTKIYLLENFWHYTFKTPLCSSFADYWYVDIEEDIIHGCKHPNQENSLSSSEKFMLEIWRSQVCGGKVNFLNMASIGDHFQNCLYTFLKLSNDLFLYERISLTSLLDKRIKRKVQSTYRSTQI